MRRGYPPNLKRHRLIAKLRAAGMSFQAIADRLGVSAQAVHEALQRNGYARSIPDPMPQVQGRHKRDAYGHE